MPTATTYRTTPSGTRVSSDGFVLDNENEAFPIKHEDVTITGTQLQGMNAAPVQVVAAVSGKAIVPIAWHVRFDHAGGTNFSGNDDLELIDSENNNVLGEATGAIAGAADIITTGTIASAAILPTTSNLYVRVKTGETTGGHATASAIVRVLYVEV